MARTTSPNAYYDALRPLDIRPTNKASSKSAALKKTVPTPEVVVEDKKDNPHPVSAPVAVSAQPAAVKSSQTQAQPQTPVVISEGVLILKKEPKTEAEQKRARKQLRSINRRDWLFNILVVIVASLIITAIVTYITNPEMSLLDWLRQFGLAH